MFILYSREQFKLSTAFNNAMCIRKQVKINTVQKSCVKVNQIFNLVSRKPMFKKLFKYHTYKKMLYSLKFLILYFL